MANSSLDPKNAALGDSDNPISPDTLRVRYRAFSERWRYFNLDVTSVAILMSFLLYHFYISVGTFRHLDVTNIPSSLKSSESYVHSTPQPKRAFFVIIYSIPTFVCVSLCDSLRRNLLSQGANWVMCPYYITFFKCVLNHGY